MVVSVKSDQVSLSLIESGWEVATSRIQKRWFLELNIPRNQRFCYSALLRNSKMKDLFPTSSFTRTISNHSLAERLDSLPMGVLLKIEGNCSCLGSASFLVIRSSIVHWKWKTWAQNLEENHKIISSITKSETERLCCKNCEELKKCVKRFFWFRLSNHSKEFGEQGNLTSHIPFFHPLYLSFPYDIHDLKSL